ncbi:MAG: hypothetical protein V3U54_13095 [Thermodesulfobacteriota bacterium]
MSERQFVLSQAEPEDLTVERQTLVILHQLIGKGSGISPNTRGRHTKDLTKAGYSEVKDWSYHNFPGLIDYLETGRGNGIEYKYLISDQISGKDSEGNLISQMVITLFERILREKVVSSTPQILN